MGRGPAAHPGTGLNWSFSSDKNSPNPTPPPSLLSGTVNSSNFSTPRNQTLNSSCASKQSVVEIPCPAAAALSLSKVGGTEGAPLSRCSEMSFDRSWCEEPGVGSGGSCRLLERPLTSTALSAQSKAPAGVPDMHDTDFDLDHFDIDDFDEDWEDSVNISAPEPPSYQPIRDGPPAKSLLSKIMSRAKGPAAVSTPAAPKSNFLTAAKLRSGDSRSFLSLLPFFKFYLLIFQPKAK